MYIHLIRRHNLSTFLRLALYQEIKANSFWYLLLAVICYLIYLPVYRLVKCHQERVILLLIPFLYAGIILLSFTAPDFVADTNKLLCRIPVFLLGTSVSRAVEEKRPISAAFALCALLLMFTDGPSYFVLEKAVPAISQVSAIYGRMQGAVCGLSFMFLLLMILPYFVGSKIDSILVWIGNRTLELYVVHIAVRSWMINVLEWNLDTLPRAAVFALVFFTGSFLGASVLRKVLSLSFQRKR